MTLAKRLRWSRRGDVQIEHRHRPGVFDPGHCRTCAQQADLLDHYRTATWALGASGTGILLAAIALFTG
jgi:hypothetical protein